MRKVYIFLLAILMAWPAGQAFAWGQKGHRIVAQIAYDNLTKKAKKRVDKVLGERGVIYWANWADEIKSDTIFPTSYDWHFQDLDAGLSDSAVVASLTDYPKVGGNLFRMLDSMENVLHHNPNDVCALKFLIHLSGDKFCPMHTAHLDDLGGNKVKLQWFKTDANLHAVWDEKIIQALGYSYSEYAQYIEDIFYGEKKAIQQMSEADLLLHLYHFTQDIYLYQSQWDGNTYHYIYHFAHPMEWQLYAAGIRLAMVLNAIYG